VNEGGLLASAEIVSFVATKNADAARAFYRDVLGLTLVSEDDFAIVFDANGRRLRVQKVQDFTPHPFTALGWWVSDIAGTVAAIRAKGFVFERYEGMGQDESGIWTAPGGAKVAWFKDPDGNLLSLTQA
jgi:catechol 2,3-dioxygenase-like lactoylglutathione lyase family enzyme